MNSRASGEAGCKYEFVNLGLKRKKLRFQKLQNEMILVAFFDSRGSIHREFVLADKTINTEYYKGVIYRLLKQIACICLDFEASNNWFLLHDNTPARNTMLIRQFWAKKKVTVLQQSSHSPDLATVYYFLFPKLKLKGHRIDDVLAIQRKCNGGIENYHRRVRNMLQKVWQSARNSVWEIVVPET